jgi:hypothetical protein
MSTRRRSPRALLTSTLAAALLSACASTPVGGDWQALEGANFALYTDGSVEEARQLHRELEEFRAAMTWFTSLQKAKLGKVRLMVFKSGTDALPYLIDKETGAWASVTASGSLGVAKLGGQNKPIDRQTLKRDLVKLWLDDARVRSPNWYREGLADLVSAFQIEGNTVQVGGLPPIELSQYAALIADEKEGRQPGALLSEEPGRYVKEDRARVWLAVHYLMVANRERQDELAAYFRAWSKGTPSADAFVAAFGQTPADFYRLEVGRYGTRALAARQYNLEGKTAEPRLREASKEEIEKLVAEVDRAVQRLR